MDDQNTQSFTESKVDVPPRTRQRARLLCVLSLSEFWQVALKTKTNKEKKGRSTRSLSLHAGGFSAATEYLSAASRGGSVGEGELSERVYEGQHRKTLSVGCNK